MQLYGTLILAMVTIAASELDQELQAKYLTMDPSEFIKTFNNRNLSWKLKKYANINIQLIQHYEHDIMSDIPVQYHEHHLGLPEHFDARKAWKNCPTISEIYNQYNCASCWAHGVANTASDRICIHTNEIVVLSEQDLECSHKHETICHTGKPLEGFRFWRDYGLVTRACKRYDPFDLNRNKCVRQCLNNLSLQNYLRDKYYAESIYVVPNDGYQIKAELYSNGPIQAMMPLYADFRDANTGAGYTTGIYEHTFGSFQGYHSVRVIGYGVENGVGYWLVANSWGKDWGENGLFRIKYFPNETLLLTGLPMKKIY